MPEVLFVLKFMFHYDFIFKSDIKK